MNNWTSSMTHPQAQAPFQFLAPQPPQPPPPPPPPSQPQPSIPPHSLLLLQLQLMLRETQAKREEATGLIRQLRLVVSEQRKVERTLQDNIDILTNGEKTQNA